MNAAMEQEIVHEIESIKSLKIVRFVGKLQYLSKSVQILFINI